MSWIIYSPATGELVTTQIFRSYESAAEIACPEDQIVYIGVGDDDDMDDKDLPEGVEV